jgi:hypothetical protein
MPVRTPRAPGRLPRLGEDAAAARPGGGAPGERFERYRQRLRRAAAVSVFVAGGATAVTAIGLTLLDPGDWDYGWRFFVALVLFAPAMSLAAYRLQERARVRRRLAEAAPLPDDAGVVESPRLRLRALCDLAGWSLGLGLVAIGLAYLLPDNASLFVTVLPAAVPVSQAVTDGLLVQGLVRRLEVQEGRRFYVAIPAADGVGDDDRAFWRGFA